MSVQCAKFPSGDKLSKYTLLEASYSPVKRRVYFVFGLHNVGSSLGCLQAGLTNTLISLRLQINSVEHYISPVLWNYLGANILLWLYVPLRNQVSRIKRELLVRNIEWHYRSLGVIFNRSSRKTPRYCPFQTKPWLEGVLGFSFLKMTVPSWSTRTVCRL